MTRHLSMFLTLTASLTIALASTVASAGLVITNSAGFNVTWDGNDGTHFGVNAPSNLASSVGTAFASSVHPAPAHEVAHLNDGVYGNDKSWLADFNTDADPSLAGIELNGVYQLTSIALGRDNGGNDPFPDQFTQRWLGMYDLQITTAADPLTTAAWTTIATLDYQSNDDTIVGGAFTGYYRHEYDVALAGGGAIPATGVRIVVGDSNNAIDELEIYGVPEPASFALLGLGGLFILRRRSRP